MKIFELFTTKTDWSDDVSYDEHQLKAEIDGFLIFLKFEYGRQTLNYLPILVNDYNKVHEVLNIGFGVRKESERHPRVSIRGDVGTRTASKILSAVINKTIEEVNRTKPDVIQFTADTDEQSRVKLYDTIVKQITRKYPDYEYVGTQYYHGDIYYLLKRKDVEL